MGSYHLLLTGCCFIAFVLALGMLYFKNALNVALCLLGVLLFTAAIYGLMGEHVVAALQLVVYAGAIMVLFIFSIMLLNPNEGPNQERLGLEQASDQTPAKQRPWWTKLSAGVLVSVIFFTIASAFLTFIQGSSLQRQLGPFDAALLEREGGQVMVLSRYLFSQHYLNFELVGLILLIATVGSVVLAKKNLDRLKN